ncbi:MAG: PAS domain S-box protein [Syntrophomonadaceae bacterium]|nr:PAS domain S-box protein [Syntrophomonadaceae bacterium]
MRYENKSKKQLIEEIKLLRSQVSEYRKYRQINKGKSTWLEAEDLFLSLIAEALFGYYVIQDGKFHFVNPKLVEIFGYTLEEMLEKVSPMDIIHPNYRSVTAHNIQMRLEGLLGSASYLIRGLKKDGTPLYLQVTGSHIIYRGRPAVHGNVLDITQQKAMEQALRNSEAKFRAIVEDQTELVSRFRPDGIHTYVNEAFCRYFGIHQADIIGHNLWTAAPEENRKPFYYLVASLNQEKPTGEVQHFVPDSNGNPRWLLWTVRAIFDENGAPVEYQAVGRDITEKRQADEARIESEKNLKRQVEYLNTLIENLNELFYTYDCDGNITFINRKSLTVLDYQPHEILGANVVDFVPEIYRDTVRRGIRRIITKGQSMSFECPVIRRDRSQRWLRLNTAPILHEGKIQGAMVLAEDITQRKQTEYALASEKEWLAVTLRSIADGVITTDTDGNINLVNDAAEILTGWTQCEVAGKPLDDVFRLLDSKTSTSHPMKLINALPAQGTVELESHILVCKNGQERIIDASGAPIRDSSGHYMGAVIVFRDITDRIRMEEELLNASKLDSLGVLAGGIAHDFNNLLTVIMGNITLAGMNLDNPETAGEFLSRSEKASMQTKGLTQQLLTFARGGAPVKKPSSLTELLRDTVNFSLCGSNVKCELNIVEDLCLADVDEGQIAQVINNLIINALQAMPQGGTVRINATNEYLTESSGLPLAAGKYIKIFVQDEGSGIPEDHHKKIFDPFFTTKSTGSGLGLATAYSIIKNHNGYIGIESSAATGTSFIIYLPVSVHSQTDYATHQVSSSHGKGRILVMDDEAKIREVVREMLRNIGYDVTLSANGFEAIQFYIESIKDEAKYDAVILDLTIPGGMGGKETIQKLLAIDPHIRAIVSSGYSNDPILAEFDRWGFKGVVTKPYGIGSLSQVLNQVMGNGSSDSLGTSV